MEGSAVQTMKYKRRSRHQLLPLAIGMACGLCAFAHGRGGLQFVPYVQYLSGGENTTGVAVTDIDQDGDVDLLCSNRWTNDVTTMINDGTGVFAFSSSVAVGLTPRYVRAADFNGDGWPDCVTPDYDGSSVSIVLNDGAGVLLLHQSVDLLRPAVLDTVDVDGDLHQDIVVAYWDENASSPSSSPALLSILHNDGQGQFTTTSTSAIGVQPRGMDIGDVNGDSLPDVVVCNLGSSDMDLLLNNGEGGFLESIVLAAPTQPRYVTLGDWDQDGAVDLAVVSKSSAIVEIQRNDGALGFATTQTLATMTNPHSCTNVDLDLDGDLDVLVSHVSSANVSIYLNDGSGTFSPRWNVYSPSGPAEVVTGDVNGDGLPDIVTANSNNHTCSIHVNATEQQPPSCDADLDNSMTVDVLDLLLVLGNWMACEQGHCPQGDITNDGQIDILDLLEVLQSWGPCDA
jgi:hypothetical protein